MDMKLKKNQLKDYNSFEPNKDIAGLNIFLTRRCNLRCSYCFVDKTNAKDISPIVLASAIEFIHKCSLISSRKIHVGYIGGEPLLNWGLFREATLKIQKLNAPIDIGFTTNGTLITQDKIEFIKDRNLRVVLSFDGEISTMSDRLFINGKASYFKVHKGLESLLTNDVPFLVQLTVTPFNVSNLFENVKHLIGLGITKLIFGFAAELEWQESSLIFLKSNMNNIFQYYKYIYRNQFNVIFKYIDDEILSYILTLTNKARISQVCPMGNEIFAIDVDGAIYPCQAFVSSKEWNLGDVFTGFNVQKRILIASLHNNMLKPCQNCKLLKFCRKCPKNNYFINGTPFLMEGFSCFIGKLIYSLAQDFVVTMNRERNLRFLNEYGGLIKQWNLNIGQ